MNGIYYFWNTFENFIMATLLFSFLAVAGKYGIDTLTDYHVLALQVEAQAGIVKAQIYAGAVVEAAQALGGAK